MLSYYTCAINAHKTALALLASDINDFFFINITEKCENLLIYEEEGFVKHSMKPCDADRLLRAFISACIAAKIAPPVVYKGPIPTEVDPCFADEERAVLSSYFTVATRSPLLPALIRDVVYTLYYSGDVKYY